jgi:hypothetical protein
MSERLVELQAILTDVRRRWTLRALLRAWTVATAAAAVILAAGIASTMLVARDGAPLLFTTALISTLAIGTIAYAFWPFRRRPTDVQIARLIEERAQMDDVVVTAVDYAARPDAAQRMLEAMSADAARALSSLDRDTIVSGVSIRQQALRAAAATTALLVGIVWFSPAVSRATNVAAAYLFPARVHVEVSPGTTKLRAGESLTIKARVLGLEGELVPTVTISVAGESRQVRMQAADTPGAFATTVADVSASFTYHVSAASARSADYDVSVISPPRVERIDLYYEFPKGLGLAPRTDEDSGDIYGPAGTNVRINVITDKPISQGHIVLMDGRRLDLSGQPQSLDSSLTIEGDGSYRVALRDHDGLESAGDTEYFIRTLDDRPPDVRILRPASDKQVTPLEEVSIEARADDDFGIASLDLVFQTPAGKERAVPLRGSKGGLTASGLHTLFMEELSVQPGDFVTYYARARDVNRGRRATEARSDIFFLEVKPFEEEFVAAQSQSMGQGSGGQSGGLQGLTEAQKQIIVATWKLDARARRARDASSQRDVKAVAKAQSDLRDRAEKASAQVSRLGGDPRRRRGPDRPAPGEDPLGKAVEAMGRAVNELDKIETTSALPHEMEALNQLLKAEAENRRREVSRQQQAGGGGGMNRPEADLSSLFDQELRRRQETNYETPNSTEEREDEQQDPLERIRELARRQDALNRQQRELMRNRERMEAEDLKRQLERLTREQNELRQEAEQMAERMQQQSSRSPQNSESNRQSGEQSGAGQSQDSRRLREISEDMRNAATGLRRQDSTQASNSGSRASERLRDLERRMQGARPDDRRRALGDVQLETRQLADAQRRLANEADRTAKGAAGDDARRRLAGDQERLAERAERLQEHVQQLAKTGQGESAERSATSDAAQDFERQKIGERMRRSAEALRQTTGAQSTEPPTGDGSRQAARQGDDLARALDRIADRLGAATGAQDSDSRRLSDELSKTQELREKVAELERTIEQLQREAKQGQQAADSNRPQGRETPAQGREQSAERQGPQQAQGQSSGSSNGQQSAHGREGTIGQSGGGTGGSGGRAQQLQREANEQSREVERLAGELRRDNPSLQGANDESWWRSVSAPGTEAFKQDFMRWESLKKNLLVSLEAVESKLSDQLRAIENKQRFNAGGHETVSEVYRELVEKYYRSLATPRRPR